VAAPAGVSKRALYDAALDPAGDPGTRTSSSPG
jgi:hypothetical protein